MSSESPAPHEPRERLTPETLEHRRAILSLMEELEAIDWYQQRVDACHDAELRRVLAHNRDEEKEHAAMVIEWLRRNDPTFADMLRRFLFTEASLGEGDEEDEGNAAPAPDGAADGSLGIGSLRKGEQR